MMPYVEVVFSSKTVIQSPGIQTFHHTPTARKQKSYASQKTKTCISDILERGRQKNNRRQSKTFYIVRCIKRCGHHQLLLRGHRDLDFCLDEHADQGKGAFGAALKPGLHEPQLPVEKSVTLVSSVVVKQRCCALNCFDKVSN